MYMLAVRQLCLCAQGGQPVFRVPARTLVSLEPRFYVVNVLCTPELLNVIGAKLQRGDVERISVCNYLMSSSSGVPLSSIPMWFILANRHTAGPVLRST